VAYSVLQYCDENKAVLIVGGARGEGKVQAAHAEDYADKKWIHVHRYFGGESTISFRGEEPCTVLQSNSEWGLYQCGFAGRRVNH